MRLYIITSAILLLATSSAFSDPSVVSGKVSSNPVSSGIRDITIWCQTPDVSTSLLVCSQIDDTYPFEACVADDYESLSDYAITSIQWWGGTWQSMDICQPDFFIVSFYNYDGSCLPGEILYEEVVSSEDYIAMEIGPRRYEYYASLTVPALQDAGHSYWLTIQAVMPFTPCGQWGWMTSLEVWGCDSLLRYPLLGIPSWEVHGNGDMAFCLYSDESVDYQPASWGGVKSLYR